jgi:DNA polymerase I-like protein with 3'-5' exonuclease and polymerase domains
MQNAIPLVIPVVADIKLGKSWGTTKKITVY